MKISTKKIAACALLAALTAIFAQISIPLGHVPLNLALLPVFVAGGFLGASGSAISQIIYILLGAIGIPVFSQFTSGFGIILGPSGGYIVGYIVAAFLTGLIVKKNQEDLFDVHTSYVNRYGCLLHIRYSMVHVRN